MQQQKKKKDKNLVAKEGDKKPNVQSKTYLQE